MGARLQRTRKEGQALPAADGPDGHYHRSTFTEFTRAEEFRGAGHPGPTTWVGNSCPANWHSLYFSIPQQTGCKMCSPRRERHIGKTGILIGRRGHTGAIGNK